MYFKVDLTELLIRNELLFVTGPWFVTGGAGTGCTLTGCTFTGGASTLTGLAGAAGAASTFSGFWSLTTGWAATGVCSPSAGSGVTTGAVLSSVTVALLSEASSESSVYSSSESKPWIKSNNLSSLPVNL